MPSIEYKIIVDDSGAIRTIQQVGDTFEDAGRKATSAVGPLAGQFTRIKEIIAGLATTLIGIQFAQVIRDWSAQLINFQTEWARVTTLIEGDTSRLRAQFLALDGSLGSSAELAKGLYLALQAGVDPAQAIGFLTTAAKLAQVALTDTATAVDLLKVTLNSYKLSTSEAAATSDRLWRVLRVGGGLAVPELSAALGKLVPVAAGLGISLEEIGAVLATLKQGGVATGQSVFTLTTMFSQLSDENSKLSKRLREMGIDASGAAIKADGLGAVLAKIATALQGDTVLTAELGIQGRQLGVLMALTGNMAGTYREKLLAVGDATVTVDTAHEKIERTVAETWKSAMASVERAIERFSDLEGITASLKRLADGTASAVNTIIENFHLIEGALAGVALAWTAAKIYLWVDVLGLIKNAIPFVIAALGGLNLALLAALPTGVVIAAITALLASLGLLAGAAYDNAKAQKELGASLQEENRVLADQAKKNAENGALWAGFTSYLANKVVPTVKATANAHKTLTDEQKKLLEEFNKQFRPLDELAKKFAQLTALGVSQHAFLVAYYDDLLKGAEAHRKFGEPIPATIASLVSQAKAEQAMREQMDMAAESVIKFYEAMTKNDWLKHTDEQMVSLGGHSRAFFALFPEENRMLEERINLAKLLPEEYAAWAEAFDKVSQKGGVGAKFTDALDKTIMDMKDVKVIVRDVGESYDSFIKKLVDAGKLTALQGQALIEYAELTKTTFKSWARTVSEEVGRVFTDLSKGIADSIVDFSNFGDTIKNIFKQMAVSIISYLILYLFQPLQKQIIGSLLGINQMASSIAGGGGIGVGGGWGDQGAIAASAIGGGGRGTGGAGLGGSLSSLANPSLGTALGVGAMGAGIGQVLPSPIGQAVTGASVGYAGGAALTSILGTWGSLAPLGGIVGAAVGLVIGIVGMFGKGRKEADKIVPTQNQVTANFAAILDELNKAREAQTLTIDAIAAAKDKIISIRDEFFTFTQQFSRAGPGARATIGSLATDILASLDTMSTDLGKELTEGMRGLSVLPTLASERVANIVEDIGNALEAGTLTPADIERAKSDINSVMEKFKAFASNFGTAGAQAIAALQAQVDESLAQLDALASNFAAITGAVKDMSAAVGSAASEVQVTTPALSAILQLATNTVASAISKLDAVLQSGTLDQDALDRAWEAVNNVMAAFTTFASGFGDEGAAAVAALQTVVDKALEQIRSLHNNLGGLGNVVAGINNAVQGQGQVAVKTPALVGVLNAAMNSISGAISTLDSALQAGTLNHGDLDRAWAAVNRVMDAFATFAAGFGDEGGAAVAALQEVVDRALAEILSLHDNLGGLGDVMAGINGQLQDVIPGLENLSIVPDVASRKLTALAENISTQLEAGTLTSTMIDQTITAIQTVLDEFQKFTSALGPAGADAFSKVNAQAQEILKSLNALKANLPAITGAVGAISGVKIPGTVPPGTPAPVKPPNFLLPEFASGGFTGTGPGPMLAVLHPGEFVLPKSFVDSLSTSFATRSISPTVSHSSTTERAEGPSLRLDPVSEKAILEELENNPAAFEKGFLAMVRMGGQGSRVVGKRTGRL